MTNKEYIQNLSDKELADLLIIIKDVNIGDENYNGEYEDYYESYWICPDGEEYFDYEDAIGHTIEWLNSERIK